MEFDVQIEPSWADKRWVEDVISVRSGHKDATFLRSHTIYGAKKAAGNGKARISVVVARRSSCLLE